MDCKRLSHKYTTYLTCFQTEPTFTTAPTIYLTVAAAEYRGEELFEDPPVTINSDYDKY